MATEVKHFFPLTDFALQLIKLVNLNSSSSNSLKKNEKK